jgi:hypothetical protein
MKMRLSKLVCSAAVVAGLTAGLSGCVSYGNTHALITPIGVAGYHTFKPANTARDIQLPEQRDPNQIAAAKVKEEQAADKGT